MGAGDEGVFIDEAHFDECLIDGVEAGSDCMKMGFLGGSEQGGSGGWCKNSAGVGVCGGGHFEGKARGFVSGCERRGRTVFIGSVEGGNMVHILACLYALWY